MQDGTSPTSMLAHWARDRTLGSGQIPIEICVMKQARDTAWLYNMMDRGTLEPGKKADLNGAAASVRSAFQENLRTTLSLTLDAMLLKPAVVNMETIGIKHPEHVYDLPVGAPRWAQDVYGCKHRISLVIEPDPLFGLNLLSLVVSVVAWLQTT